VGAPRSSGGRSPAHIENDPVWSAVQDAGVPIVMHIGGAGARCRRRGTGTAAPARPTSTAAARTCGRRTSPPCTTRGDLPLVHDPRRCLRTVPRPALRRHRARCCVGAVAHGPPRPRAQELLEERADARRAVAHAVGLHPPPGPVHALPRGGHRLARRRHRPRALPVLERLPAPEGTRDPIGKFERSFDERGIDEAARQRFYEGNYRQLVGI
jgi:hypothetical protein